MRLGTRFLTFACSLALLMSGLVLAGGSEAAEEGKAWTAEELQARVIDHTFYSTGGKGKDKWHILYYLNPDGTGVGKGWGEGWSYRVAGVWKMKGDAICSKWTNPEWGKGCWQYSDKGKLVRFKMVSGDRKGQKFLQKLVGEGNVRNLK